jgi:hypothetical protein
MNREIKFIQSAAIALCALLTIGVSSCNSGSEETESEPLKDGYFVHKKGMWSGMQYKIEETTIDSCEYIIIFGIDGRNIIHKANCKNTAHDLMLKNDSK